MVIDLCREMEAARLDAGMSYAALGRALDISDEQIARICKGQSPGLTIVRAAELLSVLGRELSARSYPGSTPVRDAGHLALEARFKRALKPTLRLTREVPVVGPRLVSRSGPPDLRAWDLVVDGGSWTIGVEAETRLHDVQAVLRRIAHKKRDGTVDRIILLVSETRHNRRVLDFAADELRSAFPGSARAALRRLRAGQPVELDSLVSL
jgi:hypothetical protein